MLSKFPALFWVLPFPFDIVTPRIEWRYKLEVARIFLRLAQDGKVIQLESGMIAFFWPEIQENPYLLEIVSTAKFSSRRDRIKKLIFALLCLHVLSLPSLQMRPATPTNSCATRANRMPTAIFYRYLILYRALIEHPWEGRKGQQEKEKTLGIHCARVHDRKGGASQGPGELDDVDFSQQIEAEARHEAELNAAALLALPSDAATLPAAPPQAEPTPAKEEPAEDHEEPVFGEEIPESTWNILRKRRLIPGAFTSHEDFANLFQSLAIANDNFQAEPGEPIDNPDTILHVVQQRRRDIERQYPRFSKHMVRMATAAQAIFCLRTADMSLREHALMLWIIEGVDFLRFHEGDCFMLHPCGAFQRYKGVPPDTSRISDFLLQLEGLFRRLPEDTPRDAVQLLQAIHSEWQRAGEDDEVFGRRCVKAAVSSVGENLLKQRGGEDAPDVDSDLHNWRFHTARAVLQLKVRLARELTEEKLLHYMVEWCESIKRMAPACCFEDCCVEYCEDGVARQARSRF